MGKIVLIMLCLMLGINNVCYADVMVPTLTEEIVYITTPLGALIGVIVTAILIISLICLAVAKINKSEESIKKFKTLVEKMFFYLMIILMFFSGTLFVILGVSVLSLISFISIFVTCYLRYKKQDKKLSYKFMCAYFVVFAFLYFLYYIEYLL